LQAEICNEKVRDLRARLEELEAEKRELEARRKRLELPAIDREMLASIVENFEQVMAESANPQKKHLLHRLVKKVLVHDRRTLEVWYGLPNRQGFADCNKWLRVLATHCTIFDPAWWQAFRVYQTSDKRPTGRGGTGRRIVFQWTPPPVVPERVYTSPLLEARRYAGILQRDPFVKTQADLAREVGVSRVRITQVMSLLRLAPEIQEQLLRLTDQQAIRFFSENRLRPLTQISDPQQQLKEFQKLLAQAPSLTH